MNADRSIFKDGFFWHAFLLGGIILSLTLWFGMGIDSGMIGYCSWVWRHYGLPPYVGCIEGDYPGIFLIHLAQMALFGESVLGFRVFNFILQLLALVMVFYLTRRFSRSSLAGLLAVLFYALYYYKLDYYNSGEREEYVLWLVFLSLVVSLVFAPRRFLRAGLVGLMVGFAFLIKPTFGLLWVLFGGWFLLEAVRERWREICKLGLIFAGGCLLPSLLVVAAYWHWGYLRELYEVPVWMMLKVYAHRPILYSVYPFEEVQELTRSSLLKIHYQNLVLSNPVLLFGGWLLLALKFQGLREKDILKNFSILGGLLLACLGSIYIQNTVWGYQQVPFWGLVTILAGWGWGLLLEKIKGGRPSLWRLIPYLGCFLLIFIGLVAQMPDYARRAAYTNFLMKPQQVYLFEYEDEERAAEYLRSRMAPEDEYFYFGAISNLPFLAGRKLTTPFPSSEPFFWQMKDGSPNPVRQKWERGYIEGLTRSRPRFFVFNTAIPVAIIYPLPADFKSLVRERMPELMMELELNYGLVKSFGKMEIYERRPGISEP